MTAVEAMLDRIHESLPQNPHDTNAYSLGDIGGHNIVIACLPKGHYGTVNANTVASHMMRSFPCIEKRLMVGIGGGVPTAADIRLGDVVVSQQVVQYDAGKILPDGKFQRTSLPTRPPQSLMMAVSKLEARHGRTSSCIPEILSDTLERHPLMVKYAHPGAPDQLFRSTYRHVPGMYTCDHCDADQLLARPTRGSSGPAIHYGNIASGDGLMKDSEKRDKLAKELDIICFEMEAAGLMDNFHCLVIRGICDYADSHKNKKWQEYAAATAAAYARELLLEIPSSQMVADGAMPQDPVSISERRKHLLDSLKFDQMESRHMTIRPAELRTCEWLSDHPEYRRWQNPAKFIDHHGFFWIDGKPGAGKSTLMKAAYNRAKSASKHKPHHGVISFFFNARGTELEKSTNGMYRSILYQMLKRFPNL